MDALAAEHRHFLSRAAQLLSSSPEFDDALQQTLAAALPALGDFGFVDIVDGDGVRRSARAHDDRDLDALLKTTSWRPQRRSDGVNLCALSSGETAAHYDIDDAWYRRVADSPEHLAVLRRLAFASMLSVPVRFRGETIGALTLFMGRSGRRHTAEHLAAAHDLASLASTVVANARLVAQHARSEAALQASEERLRVAMEAANLGTWDWDVTSDRVAWSDAVYRLHGVVPGAFGGSVADFARLVHDDDIEHVRERIAQSLADGTPYEVEFRVVWPSDGSVHWLATRATVERDAEGRPLRMAGATYDVTERVQLLAAERAARRSRAGATSARAARVGERAALAIARAGDDADAARRDPRSRGRRLVPDRPDRRDRHARARHRLPRRQEAGPGRHRRRAAPARQARDDRLDGVVRAHRPRAHPQLLVARRLRADGR
jgi:PAS domain S-box-containing protein